MMAPGTYTMRDVRILNFVNEFGIAKLEHISKLFEISTGVAFKIAYKLKKDGHIDFENYVLKTKYKPVDRPHETLAVLDFLCFIKPKIKHFIAGNSPFAAIVLSTSERIYHVAYVGNDDVYLFLQLLKLHKDVERLFIVTDKLKPWTKAKIDLPLRIYCDGKLYMQLEDNEGIKLVEELTTSMTAAAADQKNNQENKA